MNQDNRVLVRKGARTLTPAEIERVEAGFRLGTLTACTFNLYAASGGIDGDAGECG